ncbi:Hypothetical protein FKW44_009473, partial [Caligus rogercresseyi]
SAVALQLLRRFPLPHLIYILLGLSPTANEPYGFTVRTVSYWEFKTSITRPPLVVHTIISTI